MFRSLALLLPFLAAACSPLGAFDTFVGKDPGSALAASGERFAAGERGKLDVYAPRAKAGERRPVIVFFYGGSWNSGKRGDYGFAGRALAAQGFVVVIPDYRLVPEVRFPGFLEDGAQAVKWVRANIARYGGDPDRIVLAGHSAGAYNAAMLSLDPRWLGGDRAAVKGFVGLAGPYDFLPLDVKSTQAAFGGAKDLAATQPVAFASRDDPPALLLTGANDDLVLPRHSVRLAKLLSDSGARAEARLYPGLGHVGILTSIARPLRGKAPVVEDIGRFARSVTDR